MAYYISPTPHATLSSNLTQTVASTTTAYPVAFEATVDIEGLYRQIGTVNISAANPAVVSWTGHGLAIGASVQFANGAGTLPASVVAGTPYYIIATGFTANAFQISTSFGGAALSTNGETAGTGNTCTCISRIYFHEAGDYLFNISAIVDSTSNTAATTDIWFTHGTATDTANNTGGTIEPNSNTQVSNNSAQVQQVLAVPMIFDCVKGDFIRLDYRGSNANQRILAIAAASTPTRPACPSIILTINKTGR